MEDVLGNRCKWYEKNFSLEIAIPKLPVILRFDGNNFSKWTVGLNRPFDMQLHQCMKELTTFLVKETGAKLGYTQSDEITLILYSNTENSQIYNNGKRSKILSKLTGLAVNKFAELQAKYLPLHKKVANFDCRMYQVPTLNDAIEQVVWRQLDARKNSISQLARHYFSHKELQDKSSAMMKKMLLESRNVDYDKLYPCFKNGVIVLPQTKILELTDIELSKLPPKHDAITKGINSVKRTEYATFDNIWLPSLEPNRATELIFGV